MLDSLAEKSEELKKISNEKSKQHVTSSVEEITAKWNTFVESLESQRDDLNKLGEEWNVRVIFFIEIFLIFI